MFIIVTLRTTGGHLNINALLKRRLAHFVRRQEAGARNEGSGRSEGFGGHQRDALQLVGIRMRRCP